MKKITLKSKIAFLLVCLLLVLLVMPLSVSAEEFDYVDWSISEDYSILMGDGKVYEQYSFSKKFSVDAVSAYEYYDCVDMGERGYYYDGTSPVRSLKKGGDIVWIKLDRGHYIYVTDEGRRHMDAFLYEGDSLVHIKNKDYEYTYIDKELLESLDAAEHSAEVGVISLGDFDVDCYEIIIRDTDLQFSYKHGAIYRLSDGRYYYINYVRLGNQYFDADGNFSYRSGNVNALELDEATIAKIEERLDTLSYVPPTVYEYEYEHDYEDIGLEGNDVLKALFWICYEILAFIVPAVLVILSIIFANIKKMGRAKYWYIVTALGAAWIILAIILSVIAF